MIEPENMMKRYSKRKSPQRGAVLLIAMIFLLLLAIIAGTVTQTSILEFFMAGNAQFREEAFQEAQAVVTEISSDAGNFPVVGQIGYKLCKTKVGDCNAKIADLAANKNTRCGPGRQNRPHNAPDSAKKSARPVGSKTIANGINQACASAFTKNG